MIELACTGCTTGAAVHHNVTPIATATSKDYHLNLVQQQQQHLTSSNRANPAAQSAIFPSRAIPQQSASQPALFLEPVHLLSPPSGVIGQPQPVNLAPLDLRACVTATYLCVIIANSTWLNCNLLESLCNQYSGHQREFDFSDEQYLNPSSLEAALDELIAFAGGGRHETRGTSTNEADRGPPGAQDKKGARAPTNLGLAGSGGVAGQHEDQLLKQNQSRTAPDPGRLKLGTRLTRRRHNPRASNEPARDQSVIGWLNHWLRNLNFDTLWPGSSDEDDEEMLADRPQPFDTTKPLDKDKPSQILRPIDRKETNLDINQTSLKLDESTGLMLHRGELSESNLMHQADEMSSMAVEKALLKMKPGSPQVGPQASLEKILTSNKEFELAQDIESYFSGPQQAFIGSLDKNQQQLLVPVRAECHCPERPMDEVPLECRFAKCFPSDSDQKDEATRGPSQMSELSPLEVAFLLYTRQQRQAEFLDQGLSSNGSSIDNRPAAFDLFNTSLPIKVIIHGFGSGGRKSWVQDMVYKILDYEDVNVIVVDWEKGAAMPHYVHAAGNTRLVGQRLAQLIQSLNARFGLTANSYHLIGFSLGAHVAGFAGAEIRNSTPSGPSSLWVNRITGLDPASLLFEGYEPSDRLDPSDAQFVDVIHSNGDGVLRGGFGALQEMGHVDFYPNGGRVQVGCNSVLLSALSDIIYGRWQSLCNHRRALNFFMDSFEYSKCRFRSFNCDSYESYLKGECFDCGLNNEKCSYMGYFADLSLGRGKMYLTTHEEAPFCANQLLINIIGTRGYKSHWGKVEVTLLTIDGKNESFWLTSTATREANGDQSDSSSSQHSIQSLVVAHSLMANFTQVLLRYTRYKGWIYSGDESWSIDKVLITDSDGQMKSYCGYNTVLQSHIISRLDLESGNCSALIELPLLTSSTHSPAKTSSQQKVLLNVRSQTQTGQPGAQPAGPTGGPSSRAQPLLAAAQQEPTTLSLPAIKAQLGSRLTVGYFPDRWQQQRKQQVSTGFISQFNPNSNMVQFMAF